MKSYPKNLIVFFCILMSFGLMGCSENDAETPATGNSSIELSTTIYDIDAQGGMGEIGYQVLNAQYGEPKVMLACSENWIADLTVRQHKISFKVEANEQQEERKADIQVRVEGVAGHLNIQVVQKGKDAPVDDGEFVVEMQQVESNKASFKVVPKKPTVQYLVFAIDRFTVSERLRTDSVIFEHFYSKIIYTDNHLSLDQKLAPYLHAGTEENITVDGLMPYMDYVLVIAGVEVMEDNFKLITNLTKKDFTMAAPAGDGNVHFDLSVNNATATAVLNLSTNCDGKYYCDCLPVGADGHLSESEMLKALEMERHYEWCSGNSMEQVVNHFGYEASELSDRKVCKSGQQYCFFACAINDEALPVSPMTKCFFTAGPAPQSDLDIHIEATDIEEKSADVVLIPSKEEYYAYDAYMATGLEKDFDDMSDEEIIDMMLKKKTRMSWTNHFTSFVIFDGTTCLNKEVNVFAFGFDGENVTTGLVRYKFNLLESGEMPHSDNIITFTINEVTDTEVDFDIHTTTWDTYMIGYAPSEVFQGMSDDDIFNWMCTENHDNYYTRGDHKNSGWDKLTPGTSYTIVAFCHSNSGQRTTPVFKQSFTTKDAD